jgi:hypothetical protein
MAFEKTMRTAPYCLVNVERTAALTNRSLNVTDLGQGNARFRCLRCSAQPAIVRLVVRKLIASKLSQCRTLYDLCTRSLVRTAL